MEAHKFTGPLEVTLPSGQTWSFGEGDVTLVTGFKAKEPPSVDPDLTPIHIDGSKFSVSRYAQHPSRIVYTITADAILTDGTAKTISLEKEVEQGTEISIENVVAWIFHSYPAGVIAHIEDIRVLERYGIQPC